MDHFTFPSKGAIALARQRSSESQRPSGGVDGLGEPGPSTASRLAFSPLADVTTLPSTTYPINKDSISPIALTSAWKPTNEGNPITGPTMRSPYHEDLALSPSFSTTAQSAYHLQPAIGSPVTTMSHRHGTNGSTSSSGFLSAGGTRRLPPTDEDDDDQLFYHRDPTQLPRRNHTIATGPSAYSQRRLNRHLFGGSNHTSGQGSVGAGMPAPSPGKNSLSAITGGREEADDDWESMMKRKESLIPHDDEQHEVLSQSIWDPSAFAESGHRRFPSQPMSTLARSPVDSRHSPISTASLHQRSESAHVNRLDQGPFASSPIVPGSAFGSSGSGIVRRHQSLNYHAGRQAAQRLQRRSHMQHDEEDQSPRLFQNDDRSAAIQSPMQPSAFDADATPMARQQSWQTENTTRDAVPSGLRLFPAAALDETHAQLARMNLGATETHNGKPKLPSLITNSDALAQGSMGRRNGPVSASAYVPPIGHGHHRRSSSSSSAALPFSMRTAFAGAGGQPIGEPLGGHERQAIQSAHPTAQGAWRDSKRNVTMAGAGLRDGRSKGDHQTSASIGTLSSLPAGSTDLPAHGTPLRYVGGLGMTTDTNSQHAAVYGLPMAMPGHAGMTSMTMPSNGVDPMRQGPMAAPQWPSMPNPMYGTMPGYGMYGNMTPTMGAPSGNGIAPTPLAPIHVLPATLPTPPSQPTLVGASDRGMDEQLRALIAAKGYNLSTTTFDVNPGKARFFVIKSFTEDDVQRSLQHEIWASTEKGNQRLDRAFKESGGECPLYLLFSVNASGHFCGVAQMLTALDYSNDSNVWAQEGKWKGTFKVRWIYVKDVPNNRLRHIRLTNTSECKPITQSRDTQELPTEGGRQALKIIAEYPSRTTLLQGFLHEGQGTASTGDQAAVPTAHRDVDARSPRMMDPVHGHNGTPPMAHQNRRTTGGRGGITAATRG